MPTTNDEGSAEIDELKDRFRTDQRTVTLLPDPEPAPIWCPVVSPDDHLIEASDLFVDRVPRRMRSSVPRLVVDDDGYPCWRIEDQLCPVAVQDGAAGRPSSEWGVEPARFEELRPGAHDPVARLADMDLCGVWASLCFPSTTWGFAGSKFTQMRDPEVGKACVRAYNDWVLEEWCGAAPDRYIPSQLVFLGDPVEAAEEIRRNAARGFTAVSFSENPEGQGLPSMHSEYWDPFLAACEETETVINLHVGSSGTLTRPSSDSPPDALVVLFPVSGLVAVVGWIYARVPLRFPRIRIAMSEAGASWVPMLVERLDYTTALRMGSPIWDWRADEPNPVDLVARNFWFTSLEDPSAYRSLDVIGIDRVMAEVDYPHPDTTWPRTQSVLRDQQRGLDPDVVRAVCYGNATRLYGHVEPPNDWLENSEVGQELAT